MSFPTTGILDNFDGGQPATQLGANWSADPFGAGNVKPLYGASGDVQSNGNSCEVWWNPTTFGADCEAGITLSTRGAGDFSLSLRLQGGVGTTSCDGYSIYHNNASTYQFYRFTNGAGTQLGTDQTQALSDGDSFGAAMIGSTLTAWYKAAAGSWTELASVSDSTYTAGGNIGFYVGTNAAIRLDNFLGGTVVVAGGTPTRSMLLLGVG